MLKGMSIPASLSFTEAETDRRCSLGGWAALTHTLTYALHTIPFTTPSLTHSLSSFVYIYLSVYVNVSRYLWKMKNKKSSSFVPSWTRRWFSIEGPELKWYATQHAAEASGQIYLKVSLSVCVCVCLCVCLCVSVCLSVYLRDEGWGREEGYLWVWVIECRRDCWIN